MRRLTAHIFALVVLVVLCRLGLWQLDRAAYKTGLDEAASRSAALPASDLGMLRASDARPWRFVTIAPAALDLTRVWLLDNRVQGGKPGYEAFVTYEDGRRRLLVSAGWIGPYVDRGRIPDITFDLPPEPIEARIVPFPETAVSGLTDPGAPESLGDGLTRVQRLDQAMAPAGADGAIALITTTPLVAAGRVHMPEPRFTAAKHRAYAVQWFAMAVLFTLLYLRAQFGRRATRMENSGKEERS